MDKELEYDNITFKTINDDGLEVLCDVLSSYYDEDNDKLYFAFTDYTLTDNNTFKCYTVEAIKSENGYDLVEIDDNEIRELLMKDVIEGEQ